MRLKKSIFLNICLYIPIVLIVGAYIHMCFRYQSIWLFNTIVHENGRYTLIETILYFRHFLWEFLLKVIFVVFIIGAFYFYGNPVKPKTIEKESQQSKIFLWKILLAGIIAFGIVAIAFYMTANAVGYKDALLGMAQYRSSEIREILFGSHWRNHFLSNIVLYSVSAACVLLYRVLCNNGNWEKRKYSCLLYISTGGFVFLCFFFGFTNDPLVNPNYLGHQLREIFGTDLPITMLASLSILIYLEKKYDKNSMDSINNNGLIRKRNICYLFCWTLPALVLAGFIIRKVLSFDISDKINNLGATKDWSVVDLFAWHFFEHSLDYIFTLSFIYFLYLLTLSFDLKKRR